MSDYGSGYDPKYGYNRNAFAHGTPVTNFLGRTVRLIAAPIGLVSEAVHNHKDRKRSEPQLEPPTTPNAATCSTKEGEVKSASEETTSEEAPIYVDVPVAQAEELLASKQAVPADGETATHTLVPTKSNEDRDFDADEADWALDDAVTTVESEEGRDDDTLAAQSSASLSFTSKDRKGSSVSKKNGLPFPVVLPQRRPGTKTRGFVRAYAPVLQDSGIDQDTFLGFLKEFHKAVRAHPIFDVIMVATTIASFYPDPLVGLGVSVLQIAAVAGQEMQERGHINKFLEQANKELFVPRGLFALVVTYVPSTSNTTEVGSQTVDIGATAMAKYGGSIAASGETSNLNLENVKPTRMEEIREKAKQLRIASGKTRGEAEMPAMCAPLVFPTLDTMVDQASSRNGKNSDGIVSEIKAKIKSTSVFVQDYFDRRAQATYAGANPDSTLATSMGSAAPQFKSRFADPNNATNTHFFTLVTGGRFKAEPLGARRRYEKAQRKAEERRLQGLKEKSIARKLQEGILYLTIVNMPSEEELAKAKVELQRSKSRKEGEKH